MAYNSRNGGDLKPYSLEHIFNQSFDRDTQTNVVELVGYTGGGSQKLLGDSLAVKVTVSGTTTYVAVAAPGTAQATAAWQCKKVDESSLNTINLSLKTIRPVIFCPSFREISKNPPPPPIVKSLI